jgi:predicted phosphohydrolase
MLCNIKNQNTNIDAIVYTGDYSGGIRGYGEVERTCKLITNYFPTTPFISTIGNHDYWCVSSIGFKDPTPIKFRNNYNKIINCFKSYGIHFLDVDGLYRIGNTVLVGTSGWYSNPYPPTNDKNYLPFTINECGINSYILNMVESSLEKQLEELDKIYTVDTKVVFVSHFAVIPDDNDYKGSFETFGWSQNIAQMMKDKYNCKHFLQGHSHRRKVGPEVFEAGSDYYLPKYLIINI